MKKQTLKLQSEFDAAMIELYRRALVEATYHSSYFLRMLSEHRGLKTAQILLRPQKESAGFTALWERKRLDLTMEAMIHDNPKWHPLFREQELATCAARLEQHGYRKVSPPSSLLHSRLGRRGSLSRSTHLSRRQGS